jgi:hypothetical protein
LYDQLSDKTSGTVAVTDYVEGLKSRLREAWKLAADRDEKAKSASKKYYDKKSSQRCFDTGEQVLVMSPTLTGKLEDQWSGPYVVQERLNDTTYRVSTPDKQKKTCLYHVNSMKRLIPCTCADNGRALL